MSAPVGKSRLGSPFVELDDAAQTQGWEVRIFWYPYELPVLAVCTPGSGENYSRAVQPHESFDRCADIILEALRRGKLLPQAGT
jgi:hypothetical protein